MARCAQQLDREIPSGARRSIAPTCSMMASLGVGAAAWSIRCATPILASATQPRWAEASGGWCHGSNRSVVAGDTGWARPTAPKLDCD